MIGGHIGAAPRQDTARPLTPAPLKLFRCWDIWAEREDGTTLLARSRADAVQRYAAMPDTPHLAGLPDYTAICVDYVKESER